MHQAHWKTTKLVYQNAAPKRLKQKSAHMSRNTHKHLTEMPNQNELNAKEKGWVFSNDMNHFIFPVFLMITRQFGCCYHKDTSRFSLTSGFFLFFFLNLEKAILKTLKGPRLLK